MDAITLLERDHREVDGLFQRLEAGGGDRLALVREVIRELSTHAAIEEQFLYPAIRRSLPEGDALVEEALEEHQEAKDVLSDLDGMEPGDPGYSVKLQTLIEDVRHHVEEEETELLPKLRSAISATELADMGQRMERAKGIAPTRPHPLAPSTPPANVVAGAVAGVMDRGRDAAREQRTRRKESAKRPAGKRAPARKTAKRPAAKRGSAARGGRAAAPVYHVTPDPRGGWRAARKGSSRALATGEAKRDVVRRAREAARSQSGRLVVHGKDGRVQEERSYGRDPRRTRG